MPATDEERVLARRASVLLTEKNRMNRPRKTKARMTELNKTAAFAKRAEPSGVVAHDVGHGEGVEFDGVHGVAVGDDFA